MRHVNAGLASVNNGAASLQHHLDPMEIIRYEVLNHLEQRLQFLLENSSTLESWTSLAEELVALRQRDKVLDMIDIGAQIQQTASLSCDPGILELIGREALRRIDIHKHRINTTAERMARRSA